MDVGPLPGSGACGWDVGHIAHCINLQNLPLSCWGIRFGCLLCSCACSVWLPYAVLFRKDVWSFRCSCIRRKVPAVANPSPHPLYTVGVIWQQHQLCRVTSVVTSPRIRTPLRLAGMVSLQVPECFSNLPLSLCSSCLLQNLLIKVLVPDRIPVTFPAGAKGMLHATDFNVTAFNFTRSAVADGHGEYQMCCMQSP